MKDSRFKILHTPLFGVTAVTADTQHSFPRHTHDAFGIGIIRRGAQKSLSGRGVVEAGPGDIITVNPSEVHDGAPIGDHGRFWQMLYLLSETLTAATRDITEGRTDMFEFEYPVIPGRPPRGALSTVLCRHDGRRRGASRERNRTCDAHRLRVAATRDSSRDEECRNPAGSKTAGRRSCAPDNPRQTGAGSRPQQVSAPSGLCTTDRFHAACLSDPTADRRRTAPHRRRHVACRDGSSKRLCRSESYDSRLRAAIRGDARRFCRRRPLRASCNSVQDRRRRSGVCFALPCKESRYDP